MFKQTATESNAVFDLNILKAVGCKIVYFFSLLKKTTENRIDYIIKQGGSKKDDGLVLGIDLGGTNLKLGVVNVKNEIIYSETVPTENTSANSLIDQIISKCKEIIKGYPIIQIGLAIPGAVYGGYVDTPNLPLKNINIYKILQQHFKMPIKLENDANCATIGECVAGIGKTADNFLMITLGTGIGGGIIINKKLYKGRNEAGEFGRMSIDFKGEEHEDGRCGVWEKYASTSALIFMATQAAKEAHDSILYELYKKNNSLDGKLFFEAVDKKCKVALKVFDTYLKYLSVGITNLIDLFDPDVIILAGGITNVGDKLLLPLLDKYKFNVPIKISNLKNDAGIIGAARIE